MFLTSLLMSFALVAFPSCDDPSIEEAEKPNQEEPSTPDTGDTDADDEDLQLSFGLNYRPEAPDADMPLTIYFKASRTSALFNTSDDVYLHIGIVDGSDWLYVPADWNTNLDKCKMTKIEGNVWKLELKPSLREWFGSADTPISKLGIVVRNADGSKKGINSDSFVGVTDNTYEAFVPSDVVEASLPDGVVEGINVIDEKSVTLVLYDKDKNGKSYAHAYALGDFNSWTLANSPECKMLRDEAAGCWHITLTNLDPSKEYAFQYYMVAEDGSAFRLADAYSEKILDPDNDKYLTSYPESLAYPEGGRGVLSTFRTTKTPFVWSDFQIEDPDRLVIYELHLRDFTTSGDLVGAMTKIDYLKAMGINAIELMPVQEFDGNDSWGYNPCFFFALDKAYGSKQQYKEFIELCHQNGIAVIFDVVYNHATGAMPFAKLYWDSDKNLTASNNPYFNVKEPHPYGLYHDFNHESDLVRKFVRRNLQFLVEEYNIDGFRFDFTKGLTNRSCTEATASNYDASRVAILKDYYEAIVEVDPQSFVVLEHFCCDKEEQELASAGIHLWRNMNGAYCQSAMGYKSDSDFSGMYSADPMWVGFMESHDEERMGYKQTAYAVGDLKNDISVRMKQLQTNAAFALTVPGPKMIWQFGELGYDFSINSDQTGGNISNDNRTGRKPIRWDYYDVPERKELYDLYCRIGELRNTYPDLFAGDVAFEWNVTTASWANGRSLYSYDGKNELVVLGNFTNDDVAVAFPASDGLWTDYMSGTQEEISFEVVVEANSYRIFVK